MLSLCWLMKAIGPPSHFLKVFTGSAISIFWELHQYTFSGPTPGLWNQNFWRWKSAFCIFSKPSGSFWFTSKFESHFLKSGPCYLSDILRPAAFVPAGPVTYIGHWLKETFGSRYRGCSSSKAATVYHAVSLYFININVCDPCRRPERDHLPIHPLIHYPFIQLILWYVSIYTRHSSRHIPVIWGFGRPCHYEAKARSNNRQ